MTVSSLRRANFGSGMRVCVCVKVRYVSCSLCYDDARFCDAPTLSHSLPRSLAAVESIELPHPYVPKGRGGCGVDLPLPVVLQHERGLGVVKVLGEAHVNRRAFDLRVVLDEHAVEKDGEGGALGRAAPERRRATRGDARGAGVSAVRMRAGVRARGCMQTHG